MDDLFSNQLGLEGLLLVGEDHDGDGALSHRVESRFMPGDPTADATAAPALGLLGGFGGVDGGSPVDHSGGFFGGVHVAHDDGELRLIGIRPKDAGGGVEALVDAEAGHALTVGVGNPLGFEVGAFHPPGFALRGFRECVDGEVGVEDLVGGGKLDGGVWLLRGGAFARRGSFAA